MTLINTANPPPTPSKLPSAPMNWSANNLNVLSPHIPSAPIEPAPQHPQSPEFFRGK